MSRALLQQRAALDTAQPVSLGILVLNTKLLARVVAEHTLEGTHVLTTLLRWLSRVNAAREAQCHLYCAQLKFRGDLTLNQYLESLFLRLSLAYRRRLSPNGGPAGAASAQDEFRDARALVDSCYEYLDLVARFGEPKDF